MEGTAVMCICSLYKGEVNTPTWLLLKETRSVSLTIEEFT